jgi:hypothetical protein
MILLTWIMVALACTFAHAQTITWTTANQGTVAWDASTLGGGVPLPVGDSIKYTVLVRNQATGAITTITTTPITALQQTITFTEGNWLIGIRAERWTGTTKLGESTISWSDVAAVCADITGDNVGDPFGFMYYALPTAPAKLRKM